MIHMRLIEGDQTDTLRLLQQGGVTITESESLIYPFRVVLRPRLRVTVNGLRQLLSRIPSLHVDAISKDIYVIKEEINQLTLRYCSLYVHVSVVIGSPFPCCSGHSRRHQTI